MGQQPMIEIAYDVMCKKKNAMMFLKLWDSVSDIKGLNQHQKEDNIAQFFTDLSLDERFVHMGDNKWDLKARHKLEEVKKVSADDLIDDDEETEIDD